MKSNSINYSNIKNLNDLQRYKIILKKKIKLRKKLLDKHLKDLEEDFSADYIYRQSLKALKINNNLFTFVPKLFGDNNKKKFIYSIISGFSAALGTLFINKKFKKNNAQKKTATDKKPPYSSSENKEQLFI
jgi:hypothetical protein